MRSHGNGHHSPMEETGVALALAAANKALTTVSLIAAILDNNVQLVGPYTSAGGSVPAFTVWLDSALYTLIPSPVPLGNATVDVKASMSVSGTAGDAVTFTLVRDRGTVNAQVLATEESSVSAAGLASATLVFLDTNVGTFPPGFIPLVDSTSLLPSTHTYSIVATAAHNLTGTEPALVVMEQLPSGVTATIPNPPTSPVVMGSLLNYAAFAGAGISTTPGVVQPVTVIDGNIGLGPGVTSTAFTGFAPVLAGDHATSSLVYPSAMPTVAPLPPGTQGGFLYAFDYAVPTPANVNAAYNDLLAAYTDASGRPVVPANTDILAGVIPGGHTFVPGIYKWNSNVGFNGNVTLNGAGTYIFIVTGTFDLAAAAQILLAGGATVANVFFAIAGATTLHAGSVAVGQFLTKTNVAMQDASHLTGRALPQTGLTLIGNTIIEA